MRGLSAEANILGTAVQIRGDDVPAGAALGEVVQRREAAGEGVGVLEGQRGGKAEAEMFGHQRHGGHELQGVVDRTWAPLCSAASTLPLNTS